MRKSGLLLICMLSLACACQREDFQQLADDVQFTATVEEMLPDTKTILNASLASAWTKDDHIAIFRGNTLADKFRVDDSSVGKTTASFSRVSAGDSFTGGSEANITSNVAVYPYQDGLECLVYEELEDGTPLAYRIENYSYPTVQQYQANSFADDAYAMVAVTEDLEDTNLKFKNVGGALKLQLKGTACVKKLTLRGNDGEKLSGTSSITAYTDGSVPEIYMADDAVDYVELDCGEGVQLDENVATVFMISIPPTSFGSGFTVTIEDTKKGTGVVSTSKPNLVDRSRILKMPAINVSIDPMALPDVDYVDEYGVNHGNGILVDGVVWAPVNCGYRKAAETDKGFVYGKMYQWGRRYGQGYGPDDATVKVFAKGPVDLAEGQKPENAGYYYYTMDDVTDWFGSVADMGHLWNSGTADEPARSEYDPCPEGWRVPTSGEMARLLENDGWEEKVPLPYGGWISPRMGVTSRGATGFYWTSDVVGGRPVYYIVGSYMYNSAKSASYAFSVRCVLDGKFGFEPDGPETPETPETPDTPDTPDTPVTPEQPEPKPGMIDYVDELGANYGKGVLIGDVIWAPVNCGYEPATETYKGYVYGKVYQWGRRFGYGTGENWDASLPGKLESTTMTLEEGNKEEYKDLRLYATVNGLWFTDTEYADAWNAGTESNPVKSEYDPCPEGWRVPTYSEIYGLSKNRSSVTTVNGAAGYWFSGDVAYAESVPAVFLPAGGYLDYQFSGTFRGSECYYYTSSLVPGGYPEYLHATSSEVAIRGRKNPWSCSVRCVQIQ